MAYSSWLLLLVALAAIDKEWAANTLVVVIVPLLVGVLGLMHLIRLGQRRVVERSGFEGAAYISAGLFAVLCLFEVFVLDRSGPLVLLSHEKAFIAIYVLCMPARKGSVFIKFLMLVAIIGSLVTYPSATTAATLFSAAVIFVLVRRKRSGFATSLVLVGVPLIAYLLLGSLENALQGFYSAVGRTDNTQTRLFLWQQAIPYLEEDPFLGGAARVNITALANINGLFQPTPLHNSFLTLALVGGLLALGLLAVLLATIVVVAMRLSSSRSQRFVQQWLPALVAGLATFAVNPVIDSLGSSIFFYVLICMGLTNSIRSMDTPGEVERAYSSKRRTIPQSSDKISNRSDLKVRLPKL